MVMLDMKTLLDTLWFAQEENLIPPLPHDWWTNASRFKKWKKLMASPARATKLERLDAKYAADHAEKGMSRVVFQMVEKNTGKPYLLAMETLYTCLLVIEQLGGIPPLGEEWTAKVIPPSSRIYAQTELQGDLH